ncbi:hypothetical protein HGM15179_007311 [Zosterops borbonicus]|uniref:Uncharacterized protein n=1 Tax=Zosterops borbonicus TaxID=364589 RepID=A0A8K1GKP5_9PASS|nr:hypothetical protein HGM15179_007311 [Zosterops borbonicus]
METIPAASETDPLLAKVDPRSDIYTFLLVMSEMAYFRKGKSHCAPPVRGVRTCERNSPADTKVNGEGGEGSTPDAGAGILMQPMVQQDVQLRPTMVHSKGGIHLQTAEDPTLEEVDA